MEMRDRLIELLDVCLDENVYVCSAGYDCWREINYEGIADHLLANGVIVPPCNVKDTVYEVQFIGRRIQAYEITTIMWNGHFLWFTWVVKDRNGIYGNVEGFSSNQIGKTVFLTKEEAEAKLKEMKGNG